MLLDLNWKIFTVKKDNFAHSVLGLGSNKITKYRFIKLAKCWITEEPNKQTTDLHNNRKHIFKPIEKYS